MSPIDWLIIMVVLALAVAAALYGRRLSNTVEGYLVAERSAGRYLLVVSNGMAGMGAITIVAQFEMFYNAGLTANWWMLMSIPASLIIAVSGWVYYRFRQTQTMTLGEFLGQRYSQKFRVFAGTLAFASGVLNFGIFPAVGAHFIIALADLPHVVPGLGLPTHPVVMVTLLLGATMLVMLGGQVVIILTDLLFGLVSIFTMLWLVLFVWNWLDWGALHSVLLEAPAGQSRLNPMDSAGLNGFNIWYFIIGLFFSFYATMTFQGDTPYRAAPLSPHEAKMSAILIEWRGLSIRLMMLLLPLAAILILDGGGHPEIAQQANARIAEIDNTAVARQMTVPIVASELLPIGLRGAFIALVLAAFLSTHDTYLHAWASVLVRDVIEPIRGKALEQRNELRLLRVGVLIVAALILTISLTLKPSDFLLKFMVLSAAIFIGGAGAVLIGGLYTSWGSNWGAWLSLSGGSLAALAGILGQSFWADPIYPWLDPNMQGLLALADDVFRVVSSVLPGVHFQITPEQFPIDGQWWSLLTMLLASLLYVGGSVAERLLLKRAFTPPTTFFKEGQTTQQRTEPVWKHALRSMLPTSEYTRFDRVIWAAKMLWTAALLVVFVVGTTASLIYDVSDQWWSRFWQIYLSCIIVISVVITIWFGLGAVRDGKRFIKKIQQ